jgi:MFS family permease
VIKDKGLKTFFTVWIGQFASRIGTAVTRFALLIWAYEQTDSATTVALLGFFAFIPMIVVSPFAGVWVDRMDRRKVMWLADVGAGVTTAGVLLLYATGNMQIWHLHLAEALSGVFEAFQGPAYTAMTTQLLPKEQYARATGMRSVAEDGAHVFAPFVAGMLLRWIGIGGVMILDLITLLLALVTLATISVPRLAGTQIDDGSEVSSRFWAEMRVGIQHIWRRPGLLGLMLIFTGINFIDALTWLSIFPVMILARSGGSELALASVQGALGVGGVLGGLIIAVWGGPKRKIHASLSGAALSFLLGGLLLAVARSIPAWMLASWVAMIFVPFISSSNQAIWQTKVAPAVQGRALAVYGMVRKSLVPAGMLLGGVLADAWFEPAMMPGGSLADLFGPLVGTGPGAGMALMFAITAVLGTAMSLSGYLFPAVRHIEGDLPDYERDVPTVAVMQPA